MRICKNDFDVFVTDCIYCYKCSFQIGCECKWLNIVGAGTLGCGGVTAHTLSDIFTL